VNGAPLTDLPGWARGMLEEARVAHLGLLDDRDRPRVLPITFALDGEELWSAIDDKPKRPGEPARVQYLRRNPGAALTVDRYSDDWDELAWVQVLGEVSIVDTADAPAALDALRTKYEPYRASAPPGPLLRLTPERALWWSARSSH
jgi:PPOX class probable F420-dependent enzyme